jgi:hypothetical protein
MLAFVDASYHTINRKESSYVLKNKRRGRLKVSNPEGAFVYTLRVTSCHDTSNSQQTGGDR